MSDSSNHEIERRQSFRLDMEKELIDIQWTDDAGRTIKKKLACRDFSKSGLRIDSDVEIAVGTQVTVIIKSNTKQSQTLLAKVIRCLQQDNGWYEVAFKLSN